MGIDSVRFGMSESEIVASCGAPNVIMKNFLEERKLIYKKFVLEFDEYGLAEITLDHRNLACIYEFVISDNYESINVLLNIYNDYLICHEKYIINSIGLSICSSESPYPLTAYRRYRMDSIIAKS